MEKGKEDVTLLMKISKIDERIKLPIFMWGKEESVTWKIISVALPASTSRSCLPRDFLTLTRVT